MGFLDKRCGFAASARDVKRGLFLAQWASVASPVVRLAAASGSGQRQWLAAAPQPLVEEEDDCVDGRLDRRHHATGEQLAAQQEGDPEGDTEVDQCEAAGLGLQAVLGFEFVPAEVMKVEGDCVDGGLDQRDQAGGEQLTGQQVSQGKGHDEVQGGKADGLFHDGGSLW